jgi:hypothetical protein
MRTEEMKRICLASLFLALLLASPFPCTASASDFAGEWHLTGVDKSAAATITISNAAAGSFAFDYVGSGGGNSLTARITAPGRAVCEYSMFQDDDDFDDAGLVTLEFTLDGDVLKAAISKGAAINLGIGSGSVIAGSYTKGEPEYTNAGVVDGAFGSAETKERVRSLLGDSLFDGLLDVMENGVRYKKSKLTYAGRIGHGGGGAFLLIDGEKIYFLGEDLGADGGYSFVTNDAKYKNSFPAGMFKDAGKIDAKYVKITYKP